MNQYGTTARRYWAVHAPARTAALADPDRFFTAVGEQVQAQVSDLARILAGTDPSSEGYLQKVARLTTARREAEETVMRQLVWVTDPDLPLEQAREEWDGTSPSHDNLALWADRMQDSPDLMPVTAELEEMATEWAVPIDFLHQLVAAESPWAFLREQQGLLQEAATIRFLREVR